MAAVETKIDLPDSLYEKSEAIAAARGIALRELIVEALSREVDENLSIDWSPLEQPAGELPLIRSNHPGTLDLSHFDFDDLLT